MDDKIKLILHNVQQSASCHQKYLKILENYYHKISFEDFIKDFFKCLKHIFHMDIAIRNPYVERTLEFLAQFVSVLTKPNENKTQVSFDEDSPSHPFLTQVINETLKFHDLMYVQTRYYSCRLITLILQHIGYETHLDNDICDSIQESMLERILDPKASIRLQAVMALVRLQEPSNPDCPVIKAYLSLLVDANPLIRKEVVKTIAPNAITIPKISERIRDVEYHVRIAAYTRCADIGPKLFKIIARQQILKCGFHDDNKHVKVVFFKNLLPKWLSAYNGDFLVFLSALKLDADENDIVNTEEISKQVMEVFFRTVPIKEIIDALPIDKDRLIPLDNLTSEVITYWNIITNFLRNTDETEEYLENILPELTPFCNYIQSIIDSKTSKKMEEWEYLDYQYILYNLFDMAEQYDLADEVGRRTFHKLVMSILQNHKLQFKLAKKIVSIADKLISNVDTLSIEICQIISDIREPLVDKPATQNENIESFQMRELKVKIHMLQCDIEDAVDSKDFLKASVIQNELMEYKRKLEDMNKQTQVIKVKVSKDDPETICRCLDLLSALLELTSVNCVTPSLATCKSEFLLPLLTSNIVEINWRVLKCLSLLCILDRSLAEEHAKVLCIPIATYRAIPNYNKFALMESVAAVCDLIRVHGSDLFGSEDETNNTVSQHNTTRRRLYRNEDMDDVTIMDQNRMNVEFIIEIILDMLDDENEEIREIAITGISKLILTDFPVSPLLISRVILKWFNPLTEKAADRIQQKLGYLISNYTKLIKGSREIIGKAVIPTLTSIASAPRTSPLVDVDVDNVLRFLAAITNSNETTDIVHIHTNLAHMLYYKIANKPKDPVVPYLTKLLLYLEIPPENSTTIKELITGINLLLEEEEDGLDKGPRKTVMKFLEKLKASIRSNTVVNETLGNIENITQQTDNTRTSVNSIEITENNAVQMRLGENDRPEDSTSDDENILRRNEGGNVQTVTGNKIIRDNGKEITKDMEENKNMDAAGRSKKIWRDKEIMKNAHKPIKEQTTEGEINSIESGNSSSNEERRSKRPRRNLHICEPIQNLTGSEYNVFSSENSTEATEVDNTAGRRKKSLRPRSVLNQTGPCEIAKKQISSINCRNNKKYINSRNVVANTKSNRILNNRKNKTVITINNSITTKSHTGKETDSEKVKQGLKGTKDDVAKSIEITKKYDKKVQNGNHTISKNKVGKRGAVNDTESDSTADREIDGGNNRHLRRSKRPRRNLEKSVYSARSKESEKENKSKTKESQPVSPVHNETNNRHNIQTRRSTAQRKTDKELIINIDSSLEHLVAENTKNNVHMSLRKSTTISLAEDNCKVNGIKRRKSRGQKSQDLDSSGDTTLHTIIEQSQRISILEDDMNIYTPTSSSSSRMSLRSQSNSVFSTPTTISRRSKLIISETSSDSESGSTNSSIRRSSRKIRKKNMDNYVL